MKYSNFEGVVSHGGGQIVLRKGMTADDDHPIVKARPDLFGDEAPTAELSVTRNPAEFIGRQVPPSEVVEADGFKRDVSIADGSGQPRPVERATRRPGEKSPARDTSRTEPTPHTEAVKSGAEAVTKATPAAKGDESKASEKPATTTKK